MGHPPRPPSCSPACCRDLDAALDVGVRHVRLYGATFLDCDLRGSDFNHSELDYTKFSGSALAGCNFDDTNLTGAKLAGCDMKEAGLWQVDFTGADLAGADFTAARIGWCRLTNVDLTSLCDAAATLKYTAESFVDPTSIAKSIRSPGLEQFLQRIGLSSPLIVYLVEWARSQGTDVFKMLRSSFISYGGPDQPFAQKLYEHLTRAGVRTFFFPESAVPGEKLHRMMRKGVNEHDRIILVCSKDSLVRPGVLNEIEEALARESRQGGESCLIPITLDRFVFDGWTPPNPDIKLAIMDRMIADFSGSAAEPAIFDRQFLRLLSALTPPLPVL